MIKSYITEFEIISPTNDAEKAGDKLTLRRSGVFCPVGKPERGYSLLTLLDHPLHYRVSKLVDQGRSFVIPADRKKNYAPSWHPNKMKYNLVKE